MFICAGLGSATMYWAFMEWGYYYLTPGLGIAPASAKALEYSIAYSFFHWGITPWAMYAIASLAMAYHFHVRRNKGLSLASVVEAITGLNAKGPAGRVIDLVFLLATFGGLVLTITLTTSTVSRGLSDLLGVLDGFALKATLVVLVTLVFSLTSYVLADAGHAAPGQARVRHDPDVRIDRHCLGPYPVYCQQHDQRPGPDAAELHPHEPVYRSYRRR